MNTVETALSVSGLPIELQACLAALSVGQLGELFASPNAFRIEYGDGVWTGSLASFPQWGGATGPTGQPTHAFGFLQFEPATYEQTAEATKLTDVEPQSQIVNGSTLAQAVFMRATGSGLLEALTAGNLDAINNALASTWPAIPGFNFASEYTTELAALSAAPQLPPPPLRPPPPIPSTPYTVPITGGKLSVADPAIGSATLSADGQTILIEPLAVGATTVSYTVTVPFLVKALLVAVPD